MVEKNISQEFRLKNIDEARKYLTEEMNRNELISNKHKKVCTTLNYIEQFLILGSTITGCVSISAFCFFGRYSNRNYDLNGRIKNVRNNCST